MAFDMLIRGGEVGSSKEVKRLDVGISGEHIAALLEPGHGLTGATEIDATGKYVLPGGIDPHTHIEWPFGAENARDDFFSGTAAAALGGTTTVIDFIPVPRGESLLAGAEHRMRLADASAVTDFSFHPILNSSSSTVMAEIPRLIRDGHASFKIYTTYAENRLDDGEQWLAIEAISRAGGLPGFHAENHELIERLTASLVAAGRTTIADFRHSRPAEAEAEAVRTVAYFARRLGSPVYIYHLSGGVALESLLEMRAGGSMVRAETCTHYLSFDDSVFAGPEPWRFVITPPIRDAASQERLWRGVAERSLSAVASDHCAYGRSHKESGFNDYTKLPAGAPGIAARMPFVWSRGVATGRISVPDFVHLTSTGPARTLGLYPRKGRIYPGSDADIVVIDPGMTWRFPTEMPEPASDYSLYGGLELSGRPVLTTVRGAVVARDGIVVGGRGSGRHVPQVIEWRDRER